MIASLKEKTKALLAKDQLKEALNMLKRSIDEKSELMGAIVIRAGELKRMKKQFYGGVLGWEEYSTERNKLSNALLLLLADVETEDLKLFNQNIGLLADKIKNLPFRPVGKLHLVNCDRIKAYKKYATFFRPRQSLPHQFYFCVGCPTQKPASFAERLIYEIIEDVLIDDDGAIEYERMLINVKGSMVERLFFQPLPLGIDKNASILKFQKYFGQRLQHLGLDKYCVEDFIASKGMILPYKYFIFAFEIEVDDWDDEMVAYLEWIIDSFRKAKKTTSCYLFFFVINMPQAHKEINETVLQRINELTTKSNNDCLLLTEYNPVPQEQIIKWFRSANNNANPNQFEEILNYFGEMLIQQKRWDGQSDFDMMDVEELQAIVYHTYLKHRKNIYV